MLKKKVTKLMDRYESGDENLTATDVREKLENILDRGPYDEELTPKLQEAVNQFILDQHDCERYGGHCGDGGDEFIERIEEIIGYEN